MVDRSNDHLYTWTLEHDAMKNAGCCLTLFDPAKGAPEMEFEMTRSEIEPMDVTVTRDRGLGQSDEQVRFEGGRDPRSGSQVFSATSRELCEACLS